MNVNADTHYMDGNRIGLNQQILCISDSVCPNARQSSLFSPTYTTTGLNDGLL